MKRNHLALLMAVVLLLGCIFIAAPAAYADTPEDTTETPAETPSETPAEEFPEVPDIVWQILRKVIRFFKWLLPRVEPYMQ